MRSPVLTTHSEFVQETLLERISKLRGEVGIHPSVHLVLDEIRTIGRGISKDAKSRDRTRAWVSLRRLEGSAQALAEYLMCTDLLVMAVQRTMSRKADDELRLDSLELSVRTQNCLRNEGIKTLGDLTRKTEAELLRSFNFGRRSVEEIKKALQRLGRSLAG